MHTRLRDDWPMLAFVATAHAAVFVVATKIWFTPPVILPNTALQLSLLSSSASRATSSPERKVQPTRSPVPAKTTTAPSAQAPAPVTPSQPTANAAAPGTANDSSAEMTSASFDAAYLQNPKPLYPSMARRLGEQGQVLLRVQVTAEGTAADVVVQTSSGSSRLDQAALETVRKWRFVAAQQGGRAVAATIIVPIVFHLER